MKILYFGYLYDIDGVSLGAKIKVLELLTPLQNLGHEVKIYWLNRQPDSKNSAKIKTRQFFKEKFSRYLHEPNQIVANFKYFWKEKKIIQAEKPDIIIARLDVYKFSSLLISKLYKIPLLIELDSPVVYEFRTFQPHYKTNIFLLNFLEKINLNYSHKIFTVSNQIKNYYVKKGVRPENIQFISNGVDIQKFHPHIDRKKINAKYDLKDSLTIGFAGTLHFWHGINNLMKLIDTILSCNNEVRFLIVGSGGPLHNEIKEFIKNERLEDRVILTGFISYDEMPDHIAAMDIVLAPYSKLSFFYYSPLKIFEYMACGKPVVTAKLGQIVEIIKDEFNGLLCEPGNIEDMKNKIMALISDREFRERIGMEARKTVVEQHAWKNKALQLEKLCLEVANSRIYLS